MLNTHRVHHATLRVPTPAQGERLRAALPQALQQALDAVAPAGALWLLRRLPCRISLAEDVDTDEAVRALRGSLQAALQAAARADDGESLLRFERSTDALCEACADALSGRRDRGWAWARLGLWPVADPPHSDAAPRRLHGLLQALDRHPLLDTPALPDPAPVQRRRALLAALLQRGLLPRALALLAPAQWLQLADGLPGAAGLRSALDDAGPEPAAPAPVLRAGRGPTAWPDGADAAACLAVLHSTPLPAARRAAAARWLAWLACLQADAPGLAALPAAQARQRLQALAQTALQRMPPARPASGRAAAAPMPPSAPTGMPAAPAQPATAAGWRSHHAGLVHLLPLLPQALGNGRGGFAAPRERLLRLAVHGLGVPPADPVLAPWLGAEAPALWQVPPPDAQAAADRQALTATLQAVLRRHLPAAQRADIESDPWPWMLQRGATLHAEPGRWRIHFDEADTRLRRCGLDRDPGHLPWLGLAVELHYE